MSGFAQRIVLVASLPMVIVGICGVLLSVVMHEAFHILIHWGEIQTINLLPDHNAIVEIFFMPGKGDFDLAFEEATAYLITMITLVLTVMLVTEMRDARDIRSVQQIILDKSSRSRSNKGQDKRSQEKLARLLGVYPVATKNKRQ